MRTGAERGTILVEVVFLVILISLPVFYLVATLARLQAGAYAVSASAREGGRAYVTATDAAQAPGRAVSAASLVLDAHGFDLGDSDLTFSCSSATCLEPGSAVQVDGSVRVELPLIPDFLSGVMPTTIELTASHTETVDEFREP